MSAHARESRGTGSAGELLEKLRNSARPLPLSKLKSKALPAAECKAILGRLAEEGRVHPWGSGKTPYFWHIAAEDYARSTALKIAAETASTRTELARTIVTKCFRLFSRSNCETLLKKLVQSGELRELPKPGGSTTKATVLFASRFPDAYLLRLAAYVGPLLESVEQIGAKREEFVRALENRSRQGTAEPLTERVYRVLEGQQSSPGAHVAIGAIREDPHLMDVSKSEFDAAILRLADDQRIELAAHDDAYHLSEQEREMLVFEEPNRYYVAVATRRH